MEANTVALPDFVPPHPTQHMSCGILYDYCFGARVELPLDAKPCRVRITDMDADTVVFDEDAKAGDYIMAGRKYFVRWKIEIERDGNCDIVEYNPHGEDVLFWMDIDTLGDTLAWLPSVAEWEARHRYAICYVAMKRHFAEILEKQYLGLRFIEPCMAPSMPYAIYVPGIFFNGNETRQPYDFRRIGLARSVAMMLGVDAQPDRKPRLDLSAPREIKEKYVCIAAQASGAMKMWLNPIGWARVVKHLKDCGYRVLCIDRSPITGYGDIWQQMPYGAEDYTGQKPLQARIDLLKDAAFFVGGPSGLSWLAWACNVPVIMISGFSSPMAEFYTPYRVQNLNVCHACWDDCTEKPFDPNVFGWCPRGKGHECMRKISPMQVIGMIDQCISDRRRRK